MTNYSLSAPSLPYTSSAYRSTAAFITSPFIPIPEINESHLHVVHPAPKTISLNEQPTFGKAEHSTQIPDTLAAHLVSLSAEYPKIDYLFELNGFGTISGGNVVMVKGARKCGKTFLNSILITALLSGEYLGFRALKKDATALFIDSEQYKSDTQILIHNVHTLSGLALDRNHPRFHALNLRGDNPGERCKITREAVDYYQPHLLIIDGIRDLIVGGDINEPKACFATTQFLMTLTSDYPDTAVIVNLHTNKGDNNPRGHLGSELNNKVSESWAISMDGNICTFEQEISRKKPVPGKFSFAINEDGLPVPSDHKPRSTETPSMDEKILSHMKKCLPPGEKLSYSALKAKYKAETGVGNTSFDNHIKRPSVQEYLEKDAKNNYFFNYSEN